MGRRMVIRSVILFRCALVLFGLAGGFWLTEEWPGFIRLAESRPLAVSTADTAAVSGPSPTRETPVVHAAGAGGTSERRRVEPSKKTFFHPTGAESREETKTIATSRAVEATAPPPSRVIPRSKPTSPSVASPVGQRATFGFVDATAPTGEPPPIVAPVGDVAIPVAFQPLASDGELTGPQREKLGAIRERFVRDIGGPDQEPTSPEYQQRWRFAQWTADQQFRAMFGVQAFLQRQVATARADRKSTPGGF